MATSWGVFGCGSATVTPPQSPETARQESTSVAAAEPTETQASGERLPDPTRGEDHVLSWEASQLPMKWHVCLTGKPKWLSEETAREVIEEVFAEAGVRFDEDVAFVRPGIEVELDGYDSERRIGYEWLNWRDVEDPERYRGPVLGEREKMFSHDEILRIQGLEAEGREYVAIFSHQDDRFSEPAEGNPDAEPRDLPRDRLRATVKAYVAWLRSRSAL